MKLKVVRFSSQEDSSSGLLFDATNGMEFLCYTLEDERRKDKKFGETRVPAGTLVSPNFLSLRLSSSNV